MHRPKFCLILAAIAVISVSSSATHGGLMLFTGTDPGAGPGDARPNSDAAAAAFDGAAGSVGTGNASLLDFESAPIGFFESLSAAQLGVTGVSIDPAGSSDGDDTDISNVDDVLLGYNTTPGGSQFLHFIEQGSGEPPIGATFNFTPPIAAFGAYFTGIETTVAGVITVTFDNGLVQQFALDVNDQSGAQFFGFVDDTPGVQINKVSVTAIPEFPGGSLSNNEEIGIDDVRFTTAVPEPSTIALVALGFVALAGFKRR